MDVFAQKNLDLESSVGCICAEKPYILRPQLDVFATTNQDLESAVGRMRRKTRFPHRPMAYLQQPLNGIRRIIPLES